MRDVRVFTAPILVSLAHNTIAATSTGVGDYVAQGLDRAAVASTSTTSTLPTTPTVLTCPSANNTHYTDSNGIDYAISCQMYLPADADNVTRTYTTRTKYTDCAADCDNVDGCTGFTYLNLDESTGTCSFRANRGAPIYTSPDFDGDVTISGRRLSNSTGHCTSNCTTSTSFRSSTPTYEQTHTTTACNVWSTALPNNTLGWYTYAPNVTFPGAAETWSCYSAPCNLICQSGRGDCSTSGHSYASSCAPQWSAYSCSYSSYVSQHYTGSYTTTYGDIIVSTILDYPTTSTVPESYTFDLYGGRSTVIQPVWVFGEPTTSYVTSTASDYGPHTIPSDRDFIWASTTVTETTYGSIYTSAYLDMQEIPLTELYPVPTPACSVTEVYSVTCDDYCNIYGGTVDVYYWPGVTPGPDGKFANTTKPATPSTTVVVDVTMTSPSVYVSFQSVYAANSCGRIGKAYTGSVLSFDPASISTVTAEGFLYADVPNGAAVFNFGDLEQPINAAAYERQVKCVGNSGCPTIYPNYAPTISVPLELRSLDPAWSTCYGDFRGFYDPPRALRPATSVEGPYGPTTPPAPSPTVPSPYPDETGGATNAPAAKTTQTALVSATKPTAYTSPIPDDTSNTSPSKEDTSPAQSTDEPHGTSVQSAAPATTAEAATTGRHPIDPTSAVVSFLASTPYDPATSQRHSDQSGQHSTDAAAIIASLLGGDASTSGSSPYVFSGRPGTSDKPITTADPGGPETPAVSAALTLPSTTLTADANGHYIVGGHILHPGSSGVVAGGTTYSINPATSAMVADGSTYQVAQASGIAADASPVLTMPGDPTVSTNANGAYVIGSETLQPGAPVILSGHTYSLVAASDLIVDGTVQASGLPAETTSGYFVVDGHTLAEGTSTELLIAGHTLPPGGELTVAGTTYALDPSGSALVVDGVTQTVQSDAAATSQAGSPIRSPSTSAFTSSSVASSGSGNSATTSAAGPRWARLQTSWSMFTLLLFCMAVNAIL